MRGTVVEWLETLGYRAEIHWKVVRLCLGFSMPSDDWKTLCQPSYKWVPFFESGKDKAVKREGWALPFISCAPDTLGL